MRSNTTPKPRQQSLLRAWLVDLARPRWTLFFFIVTAAAALAVPELPGAATGLMVAPFTLLTLNLGAAILTLPRFRRDLPLLLFHLALLLLVVLLVAARLTYFQGGTNLAEGESFSGNLVAEEGGWFHQRAVRQLQFTNLGFRERFPGNGPFRYTDNRVSWPDDEGNIHYAVIGDDRPLIQQGYRIYTAPVRGFAPLFRWRDHAGQESLGRVQLDNAVSGERPPVSSWQLPNGPEIWAMLDTGTSNPADFAPRIERHERVNLGAERLAHQLVLRVGDQQRHTLRPGESIALAGGTLTYLNLTAWMGYRIIYDPTHPWLIGAITIGVLSLTWFYGRRLFNGTKWDSDR